MSFANPWGLLALAALPVIVAIHLFHRRFEPLPVAGLHLWGVRSEFRAAGRTRERLPITPSLLLELLAALLIALVLSQPRFGETETVTHLVVVLDGSASMHAKPQGQPSFRDAAVTELARRVETLERRSVVTLIATGHRPVMLAGPAVPWDEAEASLATWQPVATQHNFESAWDLAAQVAADSGTLLFLTDHLPEEREALPQAMEVVSVGQSLDNVALTSARWELDATAGTGSIFLQVSNLAERPMEAKVRGVSREQEVFARPLSIPAGGSVPLEADVPGGLGELRVEISAAGDGLAVDSSAVLVEPTARLVNVAVNLPDDNPARAPVERVLRHLRDVQQTNIATAHLVIGPAEQGPPQRSDVWWLGLGPLKTSDEARNAAQDLLGPYLIDKRDSLLEGVVLGGVIWGGAQPAGQNVAPLISAGSFPLLGRLTDSFNVAYVLNIELSRSNLPESPDWPILVQNLIDLRRENLPGLQRWNYRVDEDIRFRLYETADAATADANRELVLIHDGKTRPLARTSVVEVPPLQETGIYEIRDGENTVGRFAVHFSDPTESTLTRLASGKREPIDKAKALAAFELDQPHGLAILLGLGFIIAVLLSNWRIL